jgi:hypothetical protein
MDVYDPLRRVSPRPALGTYENSGVEVVNISRPFCLCFRLD